MLLLSYKIIRTANDNKLNSIYYEHENHLIEDLYVLT